MAETMAATGSRRNSLSKLSSLRGSIAQAIPSLGHLTRGSVVEGLQHGIQHGAEGLQHGIQHGIADISHKALDNVHKAAHISNTGFSKEQLAGGGYDIFEQQDKARKNLLHTQACDGTWRLLLSVGPSVIPYVVLSLDFWLSVAIYVVARLCLIFSVFEATELGDFRGLKTMGFLLALMLNFYVNTSVGRMFETNKDAMELLRCIADMALALRGYLWDTPEQQEIARRCVDYMCAAHVFAYIGFTDTYDTENLWEGFNAEFGVLTQKEDDYIKRHRELGGSRTRECAAWCLQELHHAVAKGFIPPPVASGFNNIVSGFNDHVQSLFDFRMLPIPFVSEHLLVFFIHIYLPIQTFEMAVQTEVLKKDTEDKGSQIVIEVFGAMLALLANMGFQGLFVVGAFLEQPYGNRINHSRVSSFCRLAVKGARKIFSAADPRSETAPLEESKAMEAQLHTTLETFGVDVSKDLGIRALQDLADRCARGEISGEIQAVALPMGSTPTEGAFAN